jgi:hypothetical protein
MGNLPPAEANLPAFLRIRIITVNIPVFVVVVAILQKLIWLPRIGPPARWSQTLLGQAKQQCIDLPMLETPSSHCLPTQEMGDIFWYGGHVCVFRPREVDRNQTSRCPLGPLIL